MELAKRQETSLGLETYEVLGFNSEEELELEISKLTKFRNESGLGSIPLKHGQENFGG